MKVLELGWDHLIIEYEEKRYRLSGELRVIKNEKLDVFYAWKNWINQLTTDGQAIPLSEEEKDRVISLVKECWTNEGVRICFVNDNLMITCETAPAIKRTWRIKQKEKADWFRRNWKRIIIIFIFSCGLLVLPVLSVCISGKTINSLILLVSAGNVLKAKEIINIIMDILSCMLIVTEIIVSTHLLMMENSKRKVWLQKHWKKTVIVFVIFVILLFSLKTAKWMNGIPN